jgi:carbon storage regulator
MLVLSRRSDSTIQIGADVKITVLEIHKGRVKLGIQAPNEISVWRGEPSPPAVRTRPRAAITALRPMADATDVNGVARPR